MATIRVFGATPRVMQTINVLCSRANEELVDVRIEDVDYVSERNGELPVISFNKCEFFNATETENAEILGRLLTQIRSATM